MPRPRDSHARPHPAITTERPVLADGDELVTVAVAARVAGYSEMTVRRAYRRCELTPYRRPGARAVRLRRSEVEAWALGLPSMSGETEPTRVATPHVLPTRGGPARGRFTERVDEALKRRAAA